MNFFPDEESAALARQVRAWTRTHTAEEACSVGDIDREARRLVELLGHEGLLAYAAPKDYGGARPRITARDLCIVRESLAWGSALADTMFAVQALGSYAIALAGSAEQKAQYLPPLACGEAIAAFALTEPQAGSDVLALESSASREGRGYRLNGVKRFISNAGLANTYVVFAVTDSSNKAKGISAFIVEGDTSGLSLKERIALLSPHPIGTLTLGNCFVPESQRLGAEGDGLKIALSTLDTLRCTVGAAAVGFAQRAFDEALRYSQTRRQFGNTLSTFQMTQMKLADMATDIEAARLLVYRAAAAHDEATSEAAVRSSMAKLFATEAAQRIVDQALQIHGGAGVIVGNPLERLYRDVRALRIYEGTSEIQKLVIAKQLLKKETGNGL